MLAAIFSLAAVAMAFPAAVVARQEELQLHGSRRPVPLGGVPLARDTGLHLLVADVPPFVVDVDTGRVRVVRDIPAVNLAALWVVGVGGTTAVVGAISRRNTELSTLYGIRGLSGRVSDLGTGSNVWPSSDGRAVWVQNKVDRSHCTLRLVSLDGRVIRTPRPFPCASVTAPAVGSLGLIVSRTHVINPLTRRVVFTTPLDIYNTPLGIVAGAGNKLVLQNGASTELTLLDPATHAQRTMSWPSVVGKLDEPAVDARGRFVALAFANPSWTSEAGQAFDVWLLDTDSGELTQLPDMPAFVALKSTSMLWTPDGRLVLLAKSGGKDMIAVWRPGQERLAVKTVHLPDRSSGSDSFALLTARK
jgi:hypothetical protein